MRNLIPVFCMIFYSFGFVHAQGSRPQSQTPSPTSLNSQALQDLSDRENQVDRLKKISSGTDNSRILSKAVIENITKIYRRPTGKELKMLSPDKEDLKKFAEFLQQPNTGLVKLVKDFRCAEDINVVAVSPDCLKYTMPGAGSSYSFRTNSYQIGRLSDLTYTGDSFSTAGILLQGILVNIGDVPLNEVSLKTNGMTFLTEFEPASEIEKVRETNRQIINGVQNKGLTYRRSASAEENTTYILRSIAYKGNIYRSLQGIVYDELDFDKRKDIIVSFRIVRREADGSVTILWKELESKKSPRIKDLHKNETNIKPNNFVAKK